MTSIIIDRRYCGPPNSGNGGYVCGRLARHIEGGAEITLRAPPPLDKPLDVDLSKVRIEVPQIELPPLDFGQPKQ